MLMIAVMGVTWPTVSDALPFSCFFFTVIMMFFFLDCHYDVFFVTMLIISDGLAF